MKRRVLRAQLFLGSTTEEVNTSLAKFLQEKNICVGNYVDIQLWKLGDVYQLALVYAELIDA